MYDLIVTRARVVTADGVREGGLAVSGGRVAALLAPGEQPAAARVLDAGGNYLLPGVVDSHVHFRTPGLTHKEDWAHASRAAAAGGVTTVIDMPNTSPPLTAPKEAADKAGLIEGSSLVDFRFHLGVTEATVDELCRLEPRQATSVKVFMTGHHTAPHVIRDPAVLEQIFAVAAERGIRLVLHAEDDGVFTLLDRDRPPPCRYQAYEPARPRSGGIVATYRVIELVRRHGTAAHIVHVSSAEEVELLRAARSTGLPVTFEVTPHHLSFVAEDTIRLGARIRLSPAIRQPADQLRLWQALLDGDAAVVGSDHAPHTLEEKTRPAADAPPGLPGVQELLPAVHTGLRRRFPELTPDEAISLIAQACAARPAELFGIDGRKGQLAIGFDADLVLFDVDARWTLGREAVRSKAGWSAYEGWTFTGRPVLTVRRGEVIWDGREPGPGRFGPATGIWLDAQRPVPPRTVAETDRSAVGAPAAVN